MPQQLRSARLMLILAVALAAAVAVWWLGSGATATQANGGTSRITESECNGLAKIYNKTSKSRMPGWIVWRDGPNAMENGEPAGGCVVVEDANTGRNKRSSEPSAKPKVQWAQDIWASPRWQEILWCYPPKNSDDVKTALQFSQAVPQSDQAAPQQDASQVPPVSIQQQGKQGERRGAEPKRLAKQSPYQDNRECRELREGEFSAAPYLRPWRLQVSVAAERSEGSLRWEQDSLPRLRGGQNDRGDINGFAIVLYRRSGTFTVP
jgi:hypothetical protein